MKEGKLDNKAAIARHQHAIKMHEIQIQYLDGEITGEEFDKKSELFEKQTKELERIDLELQELEYEFEVVEIAENDFIKRNSSYECFTQAFQLFPFLCSLFHIGISLLRIRSRTP